MPNFDEDQDESSERKSHKDKKSRKDKNKKREKEKDNKKEKDRKDRTRSKSQISFTSPHDRHRKTKTIRRREEPQAKNFP